MKTVNTNEVISVIQLIHLKNPCSGNLNTDVGMLKFMYF